MSPNNNTDGQFVECDPEYPAPCGARLILDVNGIIWACWSNDDKQEFIDALVRHSEIGAMVASALETGECSIVDAQ